jgi:hypothetical protein
VIDQTTIDQTTIDPTTIDPSTPADATPTNDRKISGPIMTGRPTAADLRPMTDDDDRRQNSPGSVRDP